ncbi:MAG: ABC transporter ATP-binding protein [Oleiphilaceae bacterium]|nr:ABC transporter ATP-binding protein [Oleiphilaceae bacterium]
MQLTLSDIRVRHGRNEILRLDRLHLSGDELTVVLGHNGSGKSTLMQLLARQITPQQGQVRLNDRPLADYSQKSLARQLAFLPQQLPPAAGLTVRELVRLGRFPWRGLLRPWGRDDRVIVEKAMAQTAVTPYADRLVDELSGGERQRVWIAMLLAQQSPLLLLDEPTSALDLSHQYECMTLLKDLNRTTGRGMLVILHDINLAARYADRIIALRHGELAFDGSARELLSGPRLKALYGIDLHLLEQPGQPHPVAVVA